MISKSFAVLSTLLFSTQAVAGADIALQKAFYRASEEFGVPVRILQSIAYVETRWMTPELPHSAPGEPVEHPPVYGVMGLRDDDWFGHSLREAARLIGQPADALKTDLNLNVRGAAALLRKLAKESAGSRDPRDWIEAVRAYSGIPQYTESSLYIHDVYQTMRQGSEARFEALAFEMPLFALENPATRNDGSLDDAEPEWDPSPNFMPDAITPQYIVIHDTEGNYAGSVSWLKNPKSRGSAHFILRSSDGYVKQLVKDTDRAWHARCWNEYAIGIEHEGFVNQPEFFTDVMYQKSAKLVAGLAKKWGIPVDDMHVFGHDFWSTERFAKSPLAELKKCNNHTDPGAHWDWAHYFDLLKAF